MKNIQSPRLQDASIDPEIKIFVDSLHTRYRQLKSEAEPTVQEMRRNGEIVRAPWIKGGPGMARISEHSVPLGENNIPVTIFEPDNSNGAALIYLHGGGWTLFSVNTHNRLMREYAARAGVTVIGVEYSLAPEFKFPCQLNEISAVIDWLHSDQPDLGIDPARLAIGGDSAGANLAMATALKLRDEGRPAEISALILNYGAFDADIIRESHSLFTSDEYTLNTEEMFMFWDNYLASESDRKNPLAAPINARLSALPPAFMVIAGCDILRDENLLMAQKLKDAGVDVDARLYPGAVHSFLEAVEVAQLSGKALADTCVWLKKTLE